MPKKGSLVSDHPHLQASKGKSIVLTTSNHQARVAKGIQTRSAVDETSANEKIPFVLVEDLESKEIISC